MEQKTANTEHVFPGMSIAQLVGESPNVSVRLANCIRNAQSPPFHTVKEYLSAGEAAPRSMMKLRNFGKKTAQELDCLIRCFISSRGGLPIQAPVTTPSISFHALSQSDCPSRMVHNLTWASWKERLTGKEISRRSIWELASELDLQWPFNRRHETLDKYLVYELSELKRIPGLGRKKFNTLFLCFAFAAEHAQPSLEPYPAQRTLDNIEGAHTYVTLNDLIHALLKNMAPQERAVLQGRFCLDGRRAQTLESIARIHHVTRERIRQIEAKALEKLRTPMRRVALFKALEKESDNIWRCLVQEQGVVLKQHVLEYRMLRLRGDIRLALECVQQTVTSWLSSHAKQVGDIWYKEEYSPAQVKLAYSSVKIQLKNEVLPRPVVELATHMGLEPRLFEIACALHKTIQIYKGYLAKKLGKRTKRQISLHMCLLNYGRGIAVPLSELVVRHNLLNPKANCSVRDALIVMSEAPHLFLSMGDKGWCAFGIQNDVPLGQKVAELSSSVSPPKQLAIAQANAFGYGGPGERFVHEYLSRREGARLVDILDYCKHSPEREFSISSIGPFLLTSPRIARLAPGVYCLRQQLEGLRQKATSDLLLEDRACRRYVMARYAGEPINAYPLWTASMEHKWCDWAKRSADPSLFESLLSISDPDAWLVAEHIKQHWQSIKQRHACYHLLAEPRFPLHTKMPSVRDLLIVALYARSAGYMNWILANRLTATRIDNNAAATIMSILVGVNILHATDHWQKKHSLGVQLDSWVNKLTDVLYQTGKLTWNVGTCLELIDQLQTATHGVDLGWVSTSELEGIIRTLKDTGHNGQKAIVGPISMASRASTLDQLLNIHRDKVTKIELRDLVNSLLSDAT